MINTVPLKLSAQFFAEGAKGVMWIIYCDTTLEIPWPAPTSVVIDSPLSHFGWLIKLDEVTWDPKVKGLRCCTTKKVAGVTSQGGYNEARQILLQLRELKWERAVMHPGDGVSRSTQLKWKKNISNLEFGK